jgi:carboxyl-terminal processing protease
VTLVVPVVRATVTVEFATGKKLDNGDYYIKISTFGSGVNKSFHDIVKKMAADGLQRKVIIDLRSNPGGSLDEVSNILNLFVPKDQSVVQIKFKNLVTDTYSLGENVYDFNSSKLVILINE